MGSQRPSNVNIYEFKIQNFKNQIFKLHGPTSILEYQNHLRLRQNSFHIKHIGKSSSKKLRRVIYYTLYRIDPRKNALEKHLLRKNIKQTKIGKQIRISPPPLNARHHPEGGAAYPGAPPLPPLITHRKPPDKRRGSGWIGAVFSFDQ